GQDAPARRAAYACDVTYAVNKEVAFDYLRDGLALGSRRTYAARMMSQLDGTEGNPMLLRGLYFAIVDEADSVLIDEARTPLIISGLNNDQHESAIYLTALNLARQFQANIDFVIAPTGRNVDIRPRGADKLSQLARGLGGIWEARKARDELVGNALTAIHLY